MRCATTTLLLLLALLGTSCGSGAGDDAPAGAAVVEVPADATPAAEVEISNFSFQPDVIDIDAGDTVRWTSRDATDHTVTAGASPNPSGAFDVAVAGRGDRAALRFDEPGEYRYFCTPHPFMQGTVRVRR